MIKQPFRHQNTSKGNKFQEFNEAEAYWQLRINDLPSCLAMTRLPARPGLSFNLCLADPISEYLADDQAWQGIGGDYTIHFGEQSEAMPGHKKNLPVLHATVGGFSRLWLGSVRANALAVTGEIHGEQGLLDKLEQSLSLPLPKAGWEF